MFEYLFSLHWLIFCTMVVVASSAYGFIMSLVHPKTNSFVLGAMFAAISGLCLGLLTFFYGAAGYDIEYSKAGILLAVTSGLGFYIADFQTLAMFRAGAPLGLGISAIRASVSCTGVIVGFLMLHESFDLLKFIGIVSASTGIFYLMPEKEKKVEIDYDDNQTRQL